MDNYRPDYDGRIIIVANSTAILKKELGTQIDSFPLVVRLGNFVSKDYEKYIGKKSNIISTIWHNFLEVKDQCCEKYILVNHGDTQDINRNAKIKEITNNYFLNIGKNLNISKKIILYKHERGDDEDIRKFFYKYMDSSISVNNFSLGFRTIFIIKKLFPLAKVYVHGFDFFKTGYYSNSNHNMHKANKHPYIYERVCLKKLIKAHIVYEL
jgi:hypothetical protein